MTRTPGPWPAVSSGESPPTGDPHPTNCPLAVHGHVIPREAHDPITSELQVRVACGVPLAVAARSVELEAIDLDGEPVIRPERVDLMDAGLAVDQGIERRARNVLGGLEKLPEPALEPALLGAASVGGDGLPKRSCSA